MLAIYAPLVFVFTKLWLLAIPFWAMVVYILFKLWTDGPDSN